jgi:hypothetical protein
MSGDLGPERIPIPRLRYRYDCEKILREVSLCLEETAKIALGETRKNEVPNMYFTINLPIPEDDPEILGDFHLKVYRIPPNTVQPSSIMPKRKWKNFWINSFTFYTTPYCKEDLVTTLSLLIEQERINYLPFIGEEDGIIRFSRDPKTGETNLTLFPIHKRTFKKERFVPLFKHCYDFLPYYLAVIDDMKKMYKEDLYRDTNLALSRVSDELVWVRRTKDGKDIRVSCEEEMLDLVCWGAFEFFLENNKCWLEQTNCSACDKVCWPNITIDIDPGEKVPQEKLLALLQFIHADFEEEGIKYITKFTGKRGFHITAYFNGFKLPESNYIPLKVLRHSEEMSKKQARQLIEKLSKDPFEVARDFIRCKAEQWKICGNFDFLVHDFSTHDGIDYVKVDASSVKRRGYHRAYYSLTSKGTACLPLCRNGIKLEAKTFESIRKISANPSEILEHEKELLDIEVKPNDPSYVKDFLAENEEKIFTRQFNKVRMKIGA